MDIVDAQVLLPELPTIPELPAIKTAVTTMDARNADHVPDGVRLWAEGGWDHVFQAAQKYPSSGSRWRSSRNTRTLR